ncbi:hypothetical protein N9179_01470, partial [bacterium]|nr:hypothetical protein [bacterium]
MFSNPSFSPTIQAFVDKMPAVKQSSAKQEAVRRLFSAGQPLLGSMMWPNFFPLIIRYLRPFPEVAKPLPLTAKRNATASSSFASSIPTTQTGPVG